MHLVARRDQGDEVDSEGCRGPGKNRRRHPQGGKEQRHAESQAKQRETTPLRQQPLADHHRSGDRIKDAAQEREADGGRIVAAGEQAADHCRQQHAADCPGPGGGHPECRHAEKRQGAARTAEQRHQPVAMPGQVPGSTVVQFSAGHRTHASLGVDCLAQQHAAACQAVAQVIRQIGIASRLAKPLAHDLHDCGIGLAVETGEKLIEPRLQALSILAVQQVALTRHAPGGTQEAKQIPRQHAQRPRSLPPAKTFEPGMIALHIHFDDLAQRGQQAFRLARLFSDLATSCLHSGQPGGARLLVEIRLDPPRPERRTDYRCAEDAQADFRAAGHRLVEHAERLEDRRQTDDRRGITGQHESVGDMVAQGGGGCGTQTQPERNGQQEQPWRLREQRDQYYRHRGADQGAEQAEDTLGDHHAGQRLGDDEHRHQCPLRLFEVETERTPERQAAGQQRLDGELERQRIRREECLERLSHATSRRSLEVSRMAEQRRVCPHY
ncbi:hypothetical protein D9M71_159170 [compost metagenome]